MSASAQPIGSDLRLGRVIAVDGSVLDIAFASEILAAINEAVAIQWISDRQ
jgi:hypothetical protein